MRLLGRVAVYVTVVQLSSQWLSIRVRDTETKPSSIFFTTKRYTMAKTYESRHFINGEVSFLSMQPCFNRFAQSETLVSQFVVAKDGSTFTLKSPATGKVVAQV